MKAFFKYAMATVVGLFIFVAIYAFILVMAIIGVASMSASSSVEKTEAHSVYCIDMNGTVSERVVDDEYASAMKQAFGQDETAKYGLNNLLQNIQIAAEDPNIDGIYLRGGSLAMGRATAEALRRALVDFKQSGKFIVAYADHYSQTSYYLASCADKLFVNSNGSIDWHGLAITMDFYPRMLKKLGIEMQVVKVGTFKSAVEPYILTEMSDANRLQYQVLLDDVWAEQLEAVSASRGISISELNNLADRYMAFQPQADYVTTGLVDSLCYMQDMDTVLTELTGTEDYVLLTSACLPQTTKHAVSNEVAVLYAEGDITDESGDGIVGKKMVKEINALAEDDDVKAVVLRINSGGGSAYASEQMHHALMLLKEKKPLVVSMGDYAASGGYYMSCMADYIFAERTTLTGSIGIFGMIPCLAGTADMVGLDFDGVKTNQLADLQSNMVLKGMSKEERALMQAEINRGYDLFTLRCAEGRGMTQDQIKAIGEGRVWSGVRALEIGLVDSIGGIAAAIDKAAELADIDDDYTLTEYPEEEDMMTKLLNAFSSTVAAFTPSVSAEKALEMRIGKAACESLKALEKMQKADPIQARIPYDITIE